MKKLLLFIAFVLISNLNSNAQSQSEILVSNVWILDHLVVNGEIVPMPEEINVGDGMGGIIATYPNIVTLTFTPTETPGIYKVVSQMILGQISADFIVTENNIQIDINGFPEAMSGQTFDWDYDDFKAIYLNDYGFVYGNGNYIIENNQLTLGSETTYGVFNMFDPCEYMPIPDGAAEQVLEEGQTLDDLQVEAYPGTTLIWYADEELTEVLEPDTEAESTIYYVVQVDDECTSNALAVTVVVENSSSLNETQLAQLKIYPNPSADIVNISYSSNIEYVEIIDLTGRMLSKTTVSNRETILNISSLKTGFYILNIYTTEGLGSKKIIKK